MHRHDGSTTGSSSCASNRGGYLQPTLRRNLAERVVASSRNRDRAIRHRTNRSNMPWRSDRVGPRRQARVLSLRITTGRCFEVTRCATGGAENSATQRALLADGERRRRPP
jgi:hypothetical protein